MDSFTRWTSPETPSKDIWTRRSFLRSSAIVAGAGIGMERAGNMLLGEAPLAARAPLKEFGYGDIVFLPGAEDATLEQTHGVLMGLSNDRLLKPFRMRAGVAAPGADMGGWYDA